MAYLLLAAVQVAGLLLIPFGLPGLWLQVGALVLFAWSTGFTVVSVITVAAVLGLAVLAEVAEFLLGGRYARRYGGGRRAAWGAIIGGVIGAFMGLPVPILGSIIGAFIGSFAGAALMEFTTGRGATPALRAGWGAMLGRLVATGLKVATGVSVAAVALLAALR